MSNVDYFLQLIHREKCCEISSFYTWPLTLKGSFYRLFSHSSCACNAIPLFSPSEAFRIVGGPALPADVSIRRGIVAS